MDAVEASCFAVSDVAHVWWDDEVGGVVFVKESGGFGFQRCCIDTCDVFVALVDLWLHEVIVIDDIGSVGECGDVMAIVAWCDDDRVGSCSVLKFEKCVDFFLCYGVVEC